MEGKIMNISEEEVDSFAKKVIGKNPFDAIATIYGIQRTPGTPEKDEESDQDLLIRHDESRTDEKLRQMIAAADAEADGDDGREPGDTRDEESLEDHQIQGLGAFRDVFDADGEQ
jgi:hypothetical protein